MIFSISNISKLLVLFVGLDSIMACSDGMDNILDNHLKMGQSHYSFIYNNNFAERFNLNTTNAIVLDAELQAMSIEIKQINYEYQCLLHIYVNDDIDVYKPTDGDYFFTKGSNEVFGHGYNDQDQEWVLSQSNLNIMKILFKSLDTAEDGMINTLRYKKIHRSFVPGLSVLTIKPPCYLLDKQQSPAQIWIQKGSVKNYLLGNDGLTTPKYKQNNITLNIPEKLINMAAPYIKIAVKKTNNRLDF